MSDSEAEDPQLAESGKLRINISVQEEPPMQFVVKPLTTFTKIFNMYYQKRNVQKDTYRFLHEGAAVNTMSGGVATTPKSRGWEKGKTYQIEVFSGQLGGSR